MTNGTYTFGNSESFDMERLTPGSESGKLITIPRVTIDRNTYVSRLRDFDGSVQVVEDVDTGKFFEFAVTNVNGTADKDDAEFSTFSSHIASGVGQAVEAAEHSTLHSDERRFYISSIGKGSSSYWDPKEQHYICETGRFAQPDGTPLPTIAALTRVLQRADVTIGRLSTNSAGGAYATALMGALPEGQVSHAYLKSRPNIANHPSGLLWGLGGMVLGQEWDKRQYEKNSQDPWKLGTELKSAAKEMLESIYGEDGGEWTAAGAIKSNGIKQMWTDMIAFSRGGASYYHPAAHDTAFALMQQPEALITYHFPLKDKLYGNVRRDVALFLGALAYLVPQPQLSQVEALLVPGTHHDHSAYPALRWSVENYAFDRTLTT